MVKKLNNKLISTRGLLLFETAARTRNFTIAAAELHVGQPAVSRGIRCLEEILGVQLFDRSTNGVTLTETGQMLLEHVGDGFDQIRTGLQKINSVKVRSNRVTILLPTCFAQYFLLPRSAQLRNAFPNIRFQIVTQPYTDIDLDKSNYDLCITTVSGNTLQNNRISRLWKECFVPLCSLDYLQKFGPFNSAAEIVHSHLVVTFSPQGNSPTFFDFSKWFNCQGVEAKLSQDLVIYNDYSLALQAAVDSQGIVLGCPIAQPLIESGKLVPALDCLVYSELEQCVVMSEASTFNPLVLEIRNWISAMIYKEVSGFFNHNSCNETITRDGSTGLSIG